MEIATKEQRKEKINRRRETEIRKERQETDGQEQGASGQGIMIFVFIPLKMPLRSWSSCRGHRVDDRDAPTRRKEAICWEHFGGGLTKRRSGFWCGAAGRDRAGPWTA